MRVSDKILYNTVTGNLQRNLEKMLEVQESASSGKRINRPSDDPIGVMKVIDYDTAISKTEQYQRNVDNGMFFLNATESAISSTQNILVRAKELTISALNDTNGPAERAMMAKEIDQLHLQAIQIANTKISGRYIFAGYNTGNPPYNADGDYEGTALADGGDIKVEIDSGSTIDINMPGYRAFVTSDNPPIDILGTLNDLKTALEANDKGGINNAVDNLENAMDHLSEVRAEIGARINRLETAKEYLSKLKLDLIEYKSKVEDADIADVITQLAIQQNVLEMSRASAARVLQQSLLDFLR